MNKIQVEVIKISATPDITGAHMIVLRETLGNRRLGIIIGVPEALSIMHVMEGNFPPRPMTHDLIKTIIDYLSATVKEVIIDDLRDKTYYAKIVLEVATLEHFIDARPSDAIAIALRFEAPIFISEELFDKTAIEPTSEPSSNEVQSDYKNAAHKTTPSSQFTRLGLLQEQLREALEKEDYERAAKLRDEINKLQGRSN